MSAIACVSAAEPLRQQYILSEMRVNLSVTRFETYVPDDVRESAPMTTPPSNSTAIIVVYGFILENISINLFNVCDHCEIALK